MTTCSVSLKDLEFITKGKLSKYQQIFIKSWSCILTVVGSKFNLEYPSPDLMRHRCVILSVVTLSKNAKDSSH